MDILDVSVTTSRKKGERRKSGRGYNHNPNWETPKLFNPRLDEINHLKHVQEIYREAMKGTKR